MKKFKTAIFLAFVIIMSNACTPTNEKTSTESVIMKTHENKENGIKLEVPENWLIEETPEATSFGTRAFTALHPDENVAERMQIEFAKNQDGSTGKQVYSKEILQKASENTVSEQTVSTMKENMKQEIKQEAEILVSVQPTEIDISSNPFYHTQYTFKYKEFFKEKTSYMDMYFGYVNSQYVYILTLSSDDNSKSMMNDIVKNIEFTSTVNKE